MHQLLDAFSEVEGRARMITRCSALLVGLGSPFGDDQLGWRVADAIEEKHLPGLRVCRASSPLDLLGWLENVDHLVVCDACQGGGQVGSWHRWSWPSAEVVPLKSSGSHDLGLAAALDLAERLGQLPDRVTIWAVRRKAYAASRGVTQNANVAGNGAGTCAIIGLIQSELSQA